MCVKKLTDPAFPNMPKVADVVLLSADLSTDDGLMNENPALFPASPLAFTAAAAPPKIELVSAGFSVVDDDCPKVNPPVDGLIPSSFFAAPKINVFLFLLAASSATAVELGFIENAERSSGLMLDMPLPKMGAEIALVVAVELI